MKGVVMKKYGGASVAISLFLLFGNCGKNPAGPTKQGCGQLQLWAHVVPLQKGLSKCAKTAATTWDSLVVRVTGSDMDTLLQSFKFDIIDPYVNYMLTNIPAGKSRVVDVWTKNKKNLIIHAAATNKLDIAAGEIRTVDFSLLPQRGSIFIDISNIPVTVNGDSMAMVYAVFSFNAQALSDSAKRNKNLFLSIDNVPDSARGTLCIAGLGAAYDTLYRCCSALTFYALKDTTFSVQAAKVSTGFSLSIYAGIPGVTMVTATMDTNKKIRQEAGPLIISEIMYTANDSEYIEIYNPFDTDSAFDTLFLDIDGTYRSFTNVVIPAHGFYVFGRKNLPWVNAVHPTASALDLLSGGGNDIALCAKDSSVMDWVAFLGGSNDQQWPNVTSGKKSIVLDSLASDPTYNNYGKHWVTAKTAINLANSKYASPQTAQCGTPGFKGE
jgi:hypothetical protein